jgi:hypothetical protein
MELLLMLRDKQQLHLILMLTQKDLTQNQQERHLMLKDMVLMLLTRELILKA